MKRTQKQLKLTAYHEAGHAVIGRVLTLICGGSTIKLDLENLSAGCSITHEAWEAETEWDKRGKCSRRCFGGAAWRARIITFMAGAEAERVLLGSSGDGDGDTNDRYQILRMAEQLMMDALRSRKKEIDWTKLELRLRAFTRMLVRRHRARIERVAAALLERKTLSAEELDKLVGRSIASLPS
jgi:ATP-dependent Zn protease